MSDYETGIPSSSHPFISPEDYELFGAVLTRQTKVAFPEREVIDAQFRELQDGLRVFGNREQERLAKIAGMRLCGLEVAYFFTGLFLTPDARMAQDAWVYAVDL